MSHPITIGDFVLFAGAVVGLLVAALGVWMFSSGYGEQSDGADVIRASGGIGIVFGALLTVLCLKGLIG